MQAPNTNLPPSHWLDAWHVKPNANRDYDFIDGLRGVAILMVVWSHTFYTNPSAGPSIQLIGGLSGACATGIYLFFALSGFLISWPFWKRKFDCVSQVVPPGYAQRRFWKIYPPLALSVVVLAPLTFLLARNWEVIGIAAKWLLGIPFLFPVSGKLNPVMWTLVIEVQFYALLPLVFISLKGVSPRTSLVIIPLAFLLIPVAMRSLAGSNATFNPEINSHFPAALDSFFFGLLVAGLDRAGILTRSMARLAYVGLTLWVIVLLGLAWTYVRPGAGFAYSPETFIALAKVASGCLLFLVADSQLLPARLLSAPWLRWCGIISYEWYLFHQPLIQWVRLLSGPCAGNIGRYVAVVGGSLLIGLIWAGIIYRSFSLPILKRGRLRKS